MATYLAENLQFPTSLKARYVQVTEFLSMKYRCHGKFLESPKKEQVTSPSFPLPPSWCLECKRNSGALTTFLLCENEDRMVSWKEWIHEHCWTTVAVLDFSSSVICYMQYKKSHPSCLNNYILNFHSFKAEIDLDWYMVTASLPYPFKSN